jgi:hypothetical protein
MVSRKGSRTIALTGIIGLGLVPPLLFGWSIILWLGYLAHVAGMFIPGILFRKVRGSESPSSPPVLAFHCAVGLATYCFVYGAVASLWGFTLAPVLAFVGSNLIVFSVPRVSGEHESAETFPWGSLLLGITLATLFLALPFRQYGVTLDGHVGFPYLAASDIFKHVAVVGELAKQIPPENPYFSGEKLHYYWLSHVIPSSFFRLSGGSASRHLSLQMACYLNSLLFLTALAFILWQRLGRRSAVYLGLFLALAAYSYADGLVLVQEIANRIPEHWRENLLLDRLLIEGGEEYSGMAHAWLPQSLSEPHATLALFTGTTLWMWIWARRHSRRKPGECFFAGILLAASFGQDAFVGLAFIIAGMGYLTTETLQKWNQGSYKWIPLLVVAVASGLGYVFFSVMDMHSGGSFVHPAVYWRMLLLSPLALTVELGPTFILGCLGIWLMSRRHTARMHIDLIFLLGASLLLMFFVQHELVPNIFMRKILKVIRLPLLILALIWLAAQFESRHRTGWWAPLALVVGLAIPTIGTDLHRLARADGKQGSVLVSLVDVRANEWIRANTPPFAVVQAFPDYSWDGKLYTPTVDFGDRRTAVGDWMKAFTYQIGQDRVKERADRIKNILLGEASVEETLSVTQDLGIDYVYVGPWELLKVGKAVDKFSQWGELFEEVYRRNGVTIYRFTKSRTAGKANELP